MYDGTRHRELTIEARGDGSLRIVIRSYDTDGLEDRSLSFVPRDEDVAQLGAWMMAVSRTRARHLGEGS